jgi:hypothetical protein
MIDAELPPARQDDPVPTVDVVKSINPHPHAIGWAKSKGATPLADSFWIVARGLQPPGSEFFPNVTAWRKALPLA